MILLDNEIFIYHIHRDEFDVDVEPEDITVRPINNQILARKNKEYLKNLQLCQRQIDKSGVKNLPN